MTKRIWHKGPPPHAGWWNASWSKDPEMWRWWNGKHWSFGVLQDYKRREAGKIAFDVDIGALTDEYGVSWSDYWPTNARVPRVKP